MLRLFKLTGESLAPEFNGGDFVLVSKIPFWFSPPAAGDVVAFRQPGYGLLIKRIVHIQADGSMEVGGTHPGSVDSRVFGSIKLENLLGKVIWHIRKA